MVYIEFGRKKIDLYDISKELGEKSLESFKNDDILLLQKVLSKHSDLYYNKEDPIISDFEYDELFKKLELLENNFGIDDKQSNFVGAEVLESTFQKVKHSRPMISLDNTYNNEDLEDFNTRVLKNINNSPRSSFNTKGGLSDGDILEFTLEYKFDGLGVELIYKNGNLVQAITRGNGIEGEDVTVNVMQISNIPKTIKYKKHLEVRGEVVMPISVFESLNEQAKKEGTKIFANPRNAASGSLRMKDSNVTKKRKLKFFAYDLANFDDYRLDEGIEEYYNVIISLEKLGFNISSYFIKLDGIDGVKKSIEKFGDQKQKIDFEIDGLVLKVNNVSLWQDIGFTEHHPKYAIAYKFPAEILTTKILSVEHSVGRTGAITPVANLEPINIGGVVVRRATLHNYEEVENLDARVGDSVFIKRAGEVIPKIISVIKKGERDNFEKITPPEFCPSCETKVLKDEGKVRYYCPNNIDCPAKHSEKLAFAVGKQGFNIDGFGERQVELFLELGIIHNLVDVFKIQEKAEQILELEGFKEKSVDNLIKGVEKAKNIEIATLLTALGIAGVGKKTAKTLAKLFESKQDLLLFSNSEDSLEKLDDIGPEIAKNVIEYFNNEAHQKILKELLDILNITYFENKVIDSNSIFTQKKVCITGGFAIDGKKISRDDLVIKLEDVGGEFMSSVTKKTDYLLAGEKAGSKLKKAKSLGVEVIDLSFFLNKL